MDEFGLAARAGIRLRFDILQLRDLKSASS